MQIPPVASFSLEDFSCYREQFGSPCFNAKLTGPGSVCQGFADRPPDVCNFIDRVSHRECPKYGERIIKTHSMYSNHHTLSVRLVYT